MTNRRYLLAITLLLLTSNICYGKAACDQKGLSIMKKQNDQQSAQSEEELQQIVILDVKTNKKKPMRKLRRYMLKNGENDKKSLLYFYEPSEINGSGLLSWQGKDSENQWLYIPALKKLQRIASGSKGNYFMGTDFTYADLEGEVIDKNKYKCLKTIACKDKSPCYVIEALPTDERQARQTGYSKRLLLVSKKRLTTEKIVYFDLKGKKLKTAEYLEWQAKGKLWRPNIAVMDRHGQQKTYIKIVSRRLNSSIDAMKFNKRFLQKEMHMK